MSVVTSSDNESGDSFDREEGDDGPPAKIRRSNLGGFRGANELEEMIRVHEEENLQPRNWLLSGEVTAQGRERNELLDEQLDVDYRAKPVPIITPDSTQELEAIVIRRIRKKAFDDVERKVRADESIIPHYRNRTVYDETIRKSLTELYEDKFQEKQADGEEGLVDTVIDPEVQEIHNTQQALFHKLDALFHYQFKPSEIRPEVKIVSNMASLRVEEVGPLASAEPAATLLAPEEVLRHGRAPPLAKDERTTTDRKRERRKKKRKQKFTSSST